MVKHTIRARSGGASKDHVWWATNAAQGAPAVGTRSGSRVWWATNAAQGTPAVGTRSGSRRGTPGYDDSVRYRVRQLTGLQEIRRRGEPLGSEPHRAEEALDGLADRCVIVNHRDQGDLRHACLVWRRTSRSTFKGRHPGWGMRSRRPIFSPSRATAWGGRATSRVCAARARVVVG
jgi:hypothetical protein